MRTAAIATACLLFLVSGSLAYAAPTILHGTVSGPHGLVVAARVEAVGDHVALAGTETGPDGRFTLILPDRPLGLIVSAPGYVTRTVAPVSRSEEIGVRLDEGGKSLAGRIISLEGTPIRGAVVELLTVQTRDRQPVITLHANHGVTAMRAVAENDGSFAIAGVPAGAELTWRASARGYGATQQRADWPPRYPLELVLAPEAIIAGTVTANGRPVAGVSVEASAASGSEQVTDADGRFTLRQLPPGAASVYVRPPSGLLAPSLQPVLEAGEQRMIEVALLPLSLVHGRVTRLDTGEPVVNAVLTASVDGADRLFSARTDEVGRYEVALPPGRVSIRYVGAGMVRPFPGPWDRNAPSVEVTAQAGAPVEAPDLQVEAWMVDGRTVRGQVLGVDGEPRAGATVSLPSYQITSGREQSGTTTTDADGRFELGLTTGRLPPLLGVMACSAEGDCALAIIPPEQTEPVTLRLQPPAWASAAVVDAMGEPLTVERVEIEAMVSVDERTLIPVDLQTECAPGRVTAGPLPAGVALRLSLGPNTTDRSPSASGWGSPRLQTEPGVTYELPDVVLNLAGQEVHGRVLDPQERPVAGALMTMYGLPGSTSFVETDANGEFHLTGLRSWGSFVALVATADGELCCAQRLDPADPVPATVVLSPPAAAEGRLLDVEGRPCPGVEVRVTGRWNRWDRDNLRTLPGLPFRGSGAGITDAAGRWRVEGLVPGVGALVEAWEQISNTRARETIELLEPGLNPPVEVRLQPAAEPEQPSQPAAAG